MGESTSLSSSRNNRNNLNSFISEDELLEIILSLMDHIGWSNLRSTPILLRLDRFLYTKDWSERFDCHLIHRLARVTSDHFPIILKLNTLKWPQPFRLENTWLDDNKF